ncbi:hypothetical protein [Desertihabitans aurantiacus]|uniref:hypothetical protein n=1 Tax=Desertihabitans aurantiacus TaxID=2282477 RepID=UPI000DF7B24A|nr:hypothetical protein [Desertihabitans aurantiacus]
MTPAPHGPARRTARPEVARAAEQALLPLRPLTVGEVLDAAFAVVQRDVTTVLAPPLGLAVLLGVELGGLWLLWHALASTSDVLAWVVVVLLGLLGVVVGYLLAVWVAAVVSRVCLRTVLGEGFAPATTPVTWRSSRRLLLPATGLALLAVPLSAALGWVLSLVQLVVVPFALVEDPLWAGVGSVVAAVLMAALSCWAVSYLVLAVPCYALEGATAPDWVGRPHRPTSVPGAFGRAVQLVGIRQALRATAVTAAGVGLVGLVGGLALVALVSATGVYGPVLGLDLDTALFLVERPGTWYVLAGGYLMTLVAALPFGAAFQTVLYLDLRMRSEGLDLALRFDCLDPPQPQGRP